jgi:hypothetical protein
MVFMIHQWHYRISNSTTSVFESVRRRPDAHCDDTRQGAPVECPTLAAQSPADNRVKPTMPAKSRPNPGPGSPE